MRKDFESYLVSANDQLGLAAGDENQDALLGLVQYGSDQFATDQESQREILAIQEQKRTIMERLRAGLAEIDNPSAENAEEQENVKLGARRVIKKGEHYYFFKNDKDKKKLTVGEIMTDGDWGIDYDLDAESVPRHVRKRYLVEQARRELEDCLNQQILINESSSNLVDHAKRQAYRRILAEREGGNAERKHAGLIAELMVRNFFKKITYDLDVNFEVVDVDIYRDVAEKMDFIIRRNVKKRGVQTSVHQGGDIGIQFTINPNIEVQHHKARQVERAVSQLDEDDRVDDIIFVSIPMQDIMDKYNEWKKTKFAGGPDKLLSLQDKRFIFERVMKGILPPEEIEAFCQTQLS